MTSEEKLDNILKSIELAYSNASSSISESKRALGSCGWVTTKNEIANDTLKVNQQSDNWAVVVGSAPLLLAIMSYIC